MVSSKENEQSDKHKNAKLKKLKALVFLLIIKQWKFLYNKKTTQNLFFFYPMLKQLKSLYKKQRKSFIF